MKAKSKRKMRIVVKVGTSVLTSKNGLFSKERVESISSEVHGLMNEGHDLVLVSSGAIACGMEVLGLKNRPKELPKLQACAAIGQGKLMKIYEEYFSKRKHHTAQILLTRDGVQDHERYLNTRNTLNTLLHMKILPVVNENDTVATEEIRFGDNDNLSAMVSSLIEADMLVILSDVDGFYLSDKTRVDEIHSLAQIEKELRPHLYRIDRAQTTGGMEAKLEAARFAMQSGVSMVIANGREEGILKKILSGERAGTIFRGLDKKRALRKNWLAFSQPKGEIHVDDGAKNALVKNGKSLLAGGITGIKGAFILGDTVRIMDLKGREMGRGLVNYSKDELDKIKGRRTDEIRHVLGYKYYDEVVHRDNLVITHGEDHE